MSVEKLTKEYQEKFGQRITNKEECIARICELQGDDLSDEQLLELILLNDIKDSYKMSTNSSEQSDNTNSVKTIPDNYNTALEILTKELQLSEINKYTDTKNDYKNSIQQLKESPSLIQTYKLPVYSLTSIWSFYTLVITTNFESLIKNEYINLSFFLYPSVKLFAWWILTILLCNIVFVNYWHKMIISSWTLTLQKQRNIAYLFRSFCSSLSKSDNHPKRYFTIGSLCDFISNELEIKPPLKLYFYMNISLFMLVFFDMSFRLTQSDSDDYFTLLLIDIALIFYILLKIIFIKRSNIKKLEIIRKYESLLKNSEQVQLAIESTAIFIITEFTNSDMIKKENNGLEVIYTLKD